MSDSSQGPGWWLASDGKWYPPEQAAQPQPPQPPPVAPPAPGPPPPVPPQGGSSSGISKGCIYALVAFAALIVLGVIGAIAAIAFLGGTAVDKLEEAADEDPCPFLTEAEAQDAFGNGVRVVELSGLNELLNITVDTRILPDAPDCVVIADNDASLARAARYQGSDASAVFESARDIADGTSEDQGGGLSIETDSYISDQAVTVGDEGFCTTSSLLGSAGALVRQSDTLVFVSIQPDIGTTGTVPELDLDSGGFSTDAANCALAQEVADTILG